MEPDLRITVIEPSSGWRLLNVRELWRYRELLLILIWRDITVRYKQTVLGAAWAVIQPLTSMVIFSLILGRVSGINTSSLPYSIFVFAGFLPWFFFSNSITAAAQSVVGNQSLVTKVYFPRLLIPFASIGPYVLDFVIGFALFLGMMLYYGVFGGWGFLLTPLIMLGIATAAVGVGTLLAALTVAYRDFRHVVPFMIQVWMFGTPSIYMNSQDVLGPQAQWWLPLNPAYGLILNFRAAALGERLDGYSLFVSSAMAVILFLMGCFYFRRVEREFADVI